MIKYSIIIVALFCALTSAGANDKTHQHDDANIWKQVDALFADTSGEKSPGAAIAISWNHKTLYKKGYGMADIEAGNAVNFDTAFNLASVTKQFTAYAILKLVEKGEVGLDDPITKYLPELSYDTVSVLQLMVQTSGIASPNASRLGAFSTGRAELLLGMYSGLELANEAGTYWAYNNNNYDLLSIIVERVSGQRLPEFLAKEVFQPLGMKQSYFPYGPGYTRENRAFGYQFRNENYVNVDTHDIQQSLVGAGGMYASLNDLIKWEQVLYGSGKAAKLRQLKGYYKSGKPVSYGAGFNVETQGPIISFGHGGTSGATSTYTVYFPENGASITVLIASNLYHRAGGAEKIARQVTDLLFKRFGVKLDSEPLQETKAIVTDPLLKAKIPGKWFGEVNGRMQVFEAVILDEGKIGLHFFDGTKVTLSPTSTNTFIADDMPTITVSLEREKLFLWNTYKTMGVLSKISEEDTTPIPEQLMGFFTSTALNGAVWTVAQKGEALVATNPRGRDIVMTPIIGNIIGNMRSNVFLEHRTAPNGQAYWTMIGGQIPRIKMVSTQMAPALPLIEKGILEGDIQQAWHKYRALKATPTAFSFDEGGLNSLGYSLLRKDEKEKAIAIFEMMVDSFPNSINALDSLAEGMIANQQPAKAAEAYRRILKVDPSLLGIQARLDKLKL